MRRDEFHTVKIKGRVFVATMASTTGPYIAEMRGRSEIGGVNLGSCAFIGRDRFHEGDWTVFKHDYGQPRIKLSGLNDHEVTQLASEFGIPMTASIRRRYGFFDAPAWTSLKAWVIAHPRVASSYKAWDTYLHGWYARAIQENTRGL
jgi:hypothetical protein